MANVLIIEPDAGVRMYAMVVFRDAGHRVTVAADAEDGLHYVDGQLFDLAVVGDPAPGHSGLDVAEQVSGSESAPRRVALHTGDALAAIEAELRTVAVDVVVRPAMADELLGLTRLAPDLELL